MIRILTGKVDDLLNHITMYRLVLYYCAGLLALAFIFGFFGLTPDDPTAFAFTGVVIGAVCWATNSVMSLIFRVPANTESTTITALILALIMPAVTATDKIGVAGIALAAVVAIASKFLLAIHKRHIFNPVAIGVVASAYILDQPATWWAGGNPWLMPFIVIGGLLVVRKVQRFDMLAVYILANVLVTLAFTSPSAWLSTLNETFLSSPLLFAGFAMLTEPLTAPQPRPYRLIFGVIVGALSATTVHIGDFYMTPELAFLVGNAFAFAVSPKGRFKFRLMRIEKMANGCYDFVFRPHKPLSFRPGQYLDWTLDVRHPDDRGNRRTFTIASSPGENEVRLGIKFYRGPSAFKRSMLTMKPGDVIYGSHIAGSFTLPRDGGEKLVFIAGGIGVTPFRSMVQDMIDRQEQRSVVVLYGNNKVDEIAYADVFERAQWELGIKTVYAVADGKAQGSNVHRGFIDEDLIQREVPDYLDRTFFISGPRAMVVRFQNTLRALGIAPSRIRVDFFPGFA